MYDIHSLLDAIRYLKAPATLATIIDVEGSAYRKEGAMMIVEKDGTTSGLLSGGCLESDLTERIIQNQFHFNSHTITYDMRDEDDLSWGQGAGCNGVLKVLMEPITSRFKLDLVRLKEELDQGEQVTLIKKLTVAYERTDYLFVKRDGTHFGQWSGKLPQLHVSGSNQLIMNSEQNHFLFYQQFLPKHHLIVFGAGPDVIPLVQIAAKTGFRVTVADWRPGYCTKGNFPDAARLVVGNPADVVNKLNPTLLDSVVIMTHNFQKDKELVRFLIKKELKYLGLLGSGERTNRLLAGYHIPSWVHFPIGLPISAEGPQEITISILAELIKVKNQQPSLKEYSTYGT